MYNKMIGVKEVFVSEYIFVLRNNAFICHFATVRNIKSAERTPVCSDALT